MEGDAGTRRLNPTDAKNARNRWVVTAIKEGQLWKISQPIQVI